MSNCVFRFILSCGLASTWEDENSIFCFVWKFGVDVDAKDDDSDATCVIGCPVVVTVFRDDAEI